MKPDVYAMILAAATLLAGFPAAAIAQTAPATASAVASAAPFVDAEVRKVDKSAKKITLKHGDIPNLDMTGMTMVFQVADPALLDTVKAGDKVRFKAQKINGAYVVMEMEAAR